MCYYIVLHTCSVSLSLTLKWVEWRVIDFVYRYRYWSQSPTPHIHEVLSEIECIVRK